MLEGKVALITGAGNGLGRAAAIALADRGAQVSLFGPDETSLDQAAEEIQRAGGGTFIFQGDVANKDDVNLWVDQSRQKFARIDILVNNAAIIGPPRFVEDADPEYWERTLAVNLNGMAWTCRAVLPDMMEKSAGKIINVSSGLARMKFQRFCAYSVSKAGVEQLTRSLSAEYEAFNISVNAIDPGVMDTPMQAEIRGLSEEKLGQEIKAHFIAYKTTGQLLSPEKVAELIVYLAGPKSDHITGRVLSLSDIT